MQPQIDGYWNIVPKIKKVSFPIRGKMAVQLEDGRQIIAPLSSFPSVKKVPVSERSKWYLVGGGITWDTCPEVIHIEQILGNFDNYKHEQ